MEEQQKAFECFSLNASDLIRLRRALYGPDDAKALMLRCYRKHPKATRINETMLLDSWQEQDDALNEALEGATPGTERARRQQRNDEFLAARRRTL